jgi:phospholipase/carboxylesterase
MTSLTFSLDHLHQPPRQTGSEAAPLLLLLHGIGSNEEDLFGLASFVDPRFFVISARAPLAYNPGAYAWFPLQILPNRIIADMEEAERTRQTLRQFILEVVASYPVDPKQVYLMGFSQGAIMALYLALTQPKLVAGVVAMSGRLPEDINPALIDREGLNQLPILVVHGTEDPVLPIENGRAIRDRLQTVPVSLTYREYTMGHQLSSESLTDILAWLSERLNTRT